jgi:hypothetical protein
MVLIAFALLAAADPAATSPVHVPTSAVAPATASVRILSGAKIRLSAESQPDGYVMKRAQVTLEDGTRRSAQLVEFQ